MGVMEQTIHISVFASEIHVKTVTGLDFSVFECKRECLRSKTVMKSTNVPKWKYMDNCLKLTFPNYIMSHCIPQC